MEILAKCQPKVPKGKLEIETLTHDAAPTH